MQSGDLNEEKIFFLKEKKHVNLVITEQVVGIKHNGFSAVVALYNGLRRKYLVT